jgi:hypothetical protein
MNDGGVIVQPRRSPSVILRGGLRRFLITLDTRGVANQELAALRSQLKAVDQRLGELADRAQQG